MPNKLDTFSLKVATPIALGFTPDQTESIAQSIDITYGDADYTLVDCPTFVAGVVSVCGEAHAQRTVDFLKTDWPDYIAFQG